MKKLIFTIIIKSIGIWSITCLSIYLSVRLLYLINRTNYNLIMQLLDNISMLPSFRALKPLIYFGILLGIIIMISGITLWIEKKRDCMK